MSKRPSHPLARLGMTSDDLTFVDAEAFAAICACFTLPEAKQLRILRARGSPNIRVTSRHLVTLKVGVIMH